MKFKLGILAAFVLLFVSSCSNVGESAPRFEFTSQSGDTVTSHQLKGKIIVVNVWATWCGTCIREIPDLNRLYRKYQNDTNVSFLALCDDSEDKMNKILSRFDFLYPQVPDASEYTSKLQTRLVKTYPQNLILNQDMEIVFEVSDGSKDIFSSLDAKIQELKSKHQ